MANYIWIERQFIPAEVELSPGARVLLDIWSKQMSQLPREHEDELGKGIPCEVEIEIGNYTVLRVLD